MPRRRHPRPRMHTDLSPALAFPPPPSQPPNHSLSTLPSPTTAPTTPSAATSPPISTPPPARHSPFPQPSPSSIPNTRLPEGTLYFNDRTESQWKLRGGLPTRAIAARAVTRARDDSLHHPSPSSSSSPSLPSTVAKRKKPRNPSELGLPRLTHDSSPWTSHDIDSAVLPTGRARRSRDPSEVGLPGRRDVLDGTLGVGGGWARRERARRARYRRMEEALGGEDARHAFYDADVDQAWRLPTGKWRAGDEGTGGAFGSGASAGAVVGGTGPRRNVGTGSEGDMRGLRVMDRSDRRDMPNGGGRAGGGRIGGGARWRGLLARKDLVEASPNGFASDTGGTGEDLSPRSSLDIEEANSWYSWDDPPSTSVRGWRSNHSLSYRPRPNDRPRKIRDIGRQRCLNDLTDIVDASNEPCVSYDRQIFDRAKKLWMYVGASKPPSSRWELTTVASPITWSVSGAEEGVSSTRGVGMTSVGAPPSVPSVIAPTSGPSEVVAVPTTLKGREAGLEIVEPTTGLEIEESVTRLEMDEPVTRLKIEEPLTRRKSAPPGRSSEPSLRRRSGASSKPNLESSRRSGSERSDGSSRRSTGSPPRFMPSAEEAERAFMATRDQWLGYSRKSVYGPANLEAVIFASEMEDAAEEEVLRRQQSLM